MNGSAPDVQIVRPFSQAIELTRTILFRPFDLTKWFIIGFAAWLAHIGSGRGVNVPSSNWRTSMRHNPLFDGLRDRIHQTPTPTLVVGLVVFGLVILALVILFAWLRARGRLMFADCVVRNRAAIKEPWREFRSLGNSLFLFSLIVGLGFLMLALLLVLPFLLSVDYREHHRQPGGLVIAMIVIWAGAIFLLGLAWALINHLMVPVMYRRRCRAPEAFRIAAGLISAYPGEITLYCLFWILLFIGWAVVACVATCLTCCVAALPYIGTVILLPIYVCLCAFELLFLRQFGPDFDVWFGLPGLSGGVTADTVASAAVPPVEPSPPAAPSPPEPPPVSPPEPPPA